MAFPPDNESSWASVLAFIDEYPEDANWSDWKRIALRIIRQLQSLGATSMFRVGQSMHHIVFSTLQHHGLSSEARVTIEIDGATQRVRVAHGYGNLWFSTPTKQVTCPSDDVMNALTQYLRELWLETKAAPLPHELR